MKVVDSCKLVVDEMYIFREPFRLLEVLINQLSSLIRSVIKLFKLGRFLQVQSKMGGAIAIVLFIVTFSMKGIQMEASQ